MNMNPPQMDTVFKALGDPNRLKMISLLGSRDCTVDQLKSNLEISQSSASQHLKILLQAGLVTFSKHGNFRIYSLQRAELKAAMSFFDQLWDQGLAQLKSKLEDHGE